MAKTLCYLIPCYIMARRGGGGKGLSLISSREGAPFPEKQWINTGPDQRICPLGENHGVLTVCWPFCSSSWGPLSARLSGKHFFIHKSPSFCILLLLILLLFLFIFLILSFPVNRSCLSSRSLPFIFLTCGGGERGAAA